MSIENMPNSEMKENNFQNLQQYVITSDMNSTNAPRAGLSVDELFDFLETHFDAYRERSNLKAVLPYVHACLRLYARKDYVNLDIGMILLHFYEDHNEDENDLMVFVQLLHQVLYSLDMYGNKEILFSRKVFILLIKQLPALTGSKCVSNVIACLQLYMKMFPDMRNELLMKLWNDLSERLQTSATASKTEIHILMQLFDYFNKINPNLYNDVTLVKTTQSLLKSNLREDRKCGYFLFKKIIQSSTERLQNVSSFLLPNEHTNQLHNVWTTYITILENIEENQSHLILPTLQNLNDIIDGKQLHSSWLEILFHRILSHTNNLVLRWSIEFFMGKYTCAALSINTLNHLLTAINSTILYNFEGYFLHEKYFSSMLKGDLTNLYEVLGEINWKPVPLNNLMANLKKCPPPKSMSFENLLKIASKVRTLTDVPIRENTASMLNLHLGLIIADMNIEQYVTYIETLLTPQDQCDVFKVLFKKAPVFLEEKQESPFRKKFYEIALANLKLTTDTELMSFLEKIPPKRHGYLKFLAFHFEGHNLQIEKELQKLNSQYGIGRSSSNKAQTMAMSIKESSAKKGDKPTKDELEQAELAAVAVSIKILKSLDHISEENLGQMLMHKLPEQCIRKLCKCLEQTTTILGSWTLCRFFEILSSVRCFHIEYYNVCLYLEKHGLCDEYMEEMLKICPKYVKTSKTNILKHIKLENVLCDDVKKGEYRIEENYRYHLKLSKPLQWDLRVLWFHMLESYGDYGCIFQLLHYYKDISKKKKRYFANSYEHRMKMRITAGLAYIFCKLTPNERILDEIWSILLNENNQLNITYFFEYVLSKFEKRNTILLQQLEKISILSVVFNHCIQNENEANFKNTVVTNFLSLTMGANFNTRLFAQMALIILLKTDQFKSIQNWNQTLQSLEIATKHKVAEQLYDTRLYLGGGYNPFMMWTGIMYATNTPYDENISLNEYVAVFESDVFHKCRDQFFKKLEASTKDVSESCDKGILNNQLQRKMNPSMDIVECNNLFIYPVKEVNAEMIVIASLVDKLPNLGGIARTCEVLGIRNIVMDSKKDMEKNDFKNLSMTAEKTLNIFEVKQKDLSEFIINKQKEGFAVVGAEQTSNSQSFADFKFPQKCILLLGHEKDGIPPTLLGLLDHAVEIPQFGQVRSLNVHVTGALFMWEYCKQHMVL